jgi:hypothetical protein
MGMFDTYEPLPRLACPVCDVPLMRFQGKDGPCVLLLWRQGEAAPVAHEVDADVRFSDERLAEFRLPPIFDMTDICPNGHVVDAVGRCTDDVWIQTDLIEREWREKGYREKGRPVR